jgi:predicted nucleic acid-binding Zn ribbon protein
MAEHKFTKIGDILPSILKAAGLDQKLREIEVLSSWAEVVGEDVAARTQAVKIHNGTLYVHVSHGAWMQELRFIEKQIIEKLRARVPGVEINHIRYSTSPIKSS